MLSWRATSLGRRGRRGEDVQTHSNRKLPHTVPGSPQDRTRWRPVAKDAVAQHDAGHALNSAAAAYQEVGHAAAAPPAGCTSAVEPGEGEIGSKPNRSASGSAGTWRFPSFPTAFTQRMSWRLGRSASSNSASCVLCPELAALNGDEAGTCATVQHEAAPPRGENALSDRQDLVEAEAMFFAKFDPSAYYDPISARREEDEFDLELTEEDYAPRFRGPTEWTRFSVSPELAVSGADKDDAAVDCAERDSVVKGDAGSGDCHNTSSASASGCSHAAGEREGQKRAQRPQSAARLRLKHPNVLTVQEREARSRQQTSTRLRVQESNSAVKNMDLLMVAAEKEALLRNQRRGAAAEETKSQNRNKEKTEQENERREREREELVRARRAQRVQEMKREAEEQKTHHMDDFAQQRNRILQEALKSARNRAQTSHGPRAPSEESSASRRKDSSAQEKRTEHAEDKQSGNMPGAGRQRPASANTRYFQDFEQRKYTERREREARQRQQSSRRSAPAPHAATDARDFWEGSAVQRHEAKYKEFSEKARNGDKLSLQEIPFPDGSALLKEAVRKLDGKQQNKVVKT